MNVARYLVLVVVFLAGAASPAWAYIGPGAGLTAIGAALAFVGAILLAIAGFIWYPIKRLLKGRARKTGDTAA